ncbi:MAG: hypothetical protein KBD60_08385 [Sterolibacterium sp.]|jgi:hypothetical protein|nr:hypothetical protein [Sterolibacterium sp.]
MFKTLHCAIPLIFAVSLCPVMAQADEAGSGPRWGSSTEQTTRAQVVGGKGYYDTEKVAKEGGVIRLKLYATASMADTRVIEEVAINCETRETARVKSGAPAGKEVWDAPSPLLAGEALYATARELCGWGPGFFKRLAD